MRGDGSFFRESLQRSAGAAAWMGTCAFFLSLTLVARAAAQQRASGAEAAEQKERMHAQQDSRQRMESVMGRLPGKDRRLPLDLQIEGEVDMGTYRRLQITYQTDRDCRTPAYLCLPHAARQHPAPAVLCLHPTDHRHGHGVVVGLGGRPGRQYATELAERGYVTLAPAYPLLANYWPNLPRLGYDSGTMKAIWDNMRGLDLLTTLPEVDSSHGFGAIGHSLGGHNALFTAAMDRRLQVVVSSCGFDSFADYYGGNVKNWYFGRGWCQLRYMPRLSDFRGRLQEIPFDFPDVLAAIAPRRCFLSAPRADSNFVSDSAARCVRKARLAYANQNAAEHLTLQQPNVGHDFPEDVRESAYLAIAAVLRPQREHTNDAVLRPSAP